ncbi:hypothetical protein PROFUN_15115 [Planoprotostelium fungivorum]|uniref:Uncharacterized protein n=1 Tax=Planoprotostelium fungivorum TaxID=1890364 RepID=A0A2P6MZT7_9EUKA|nr:hypothetical protein PROFUN_15115 [Planoprotostelium fungivorum]
MSPKPELSRKTRLLQIFVMIFCLICIGVVGWYLANWVSTIKAGNTLGIILYSLSIFFTLLFATCCIIVAWMTKSKLLKMAAQGLIMIALFTLAQMIVTSVGFAFCDQPKNSINGICYTDKNSQIFLYYLPSCILITAAVSTDTSFTLTSFQFTAGVLACVLLPSMNSDKLEGGSASGGGGNYY